MNDSRGVLAVFGQHPLLWPGGMMKKMRGPFRQTLGLNRLADELGRGVLVEVGSFGGESALIFANSGKFDRIYCVDPWNNRSYDLLPDRYRHYLNIDMLEVEREFDETISPFPHIKKMKMTSEEAAKIIDFQVDMVYIDAIHEYEFVRRDIELWKVKVKPGGWCCGHDYCDKFPGVVKAVNERFGKPKVYEDTSWAVQVVS